MGVDSGLPDFCGNAGFWRAYPALGRTQRNFTEIASARAFAHEPRLAWYRDVLKADGFTPAAVRSAPGPTTGLR